MQVATVEKEIWSPKAFFGVWAQRIVMRQRAGFRVTVSPVHRIEREPTQLLLEPELSEHPNRVRALLDAGTDPCECARLLVDLNSHADPQERGRSSKSSNTGAYDRDFEFFFRQSSHPGKAVHENVHSRGANSQDSSHCCKVGSEIHWNHPAIFGGSLMPSSRPTRDAKRLAILAALIGRSSGTLAETEVAALFFAGAR